MSGRWRWARRLGRLLLVALVTWALFRAVNTGFGELGRADLMRWRPAAWPIVGSMLLLVGVYVLHAVLWRRIAADVAGVRPPFAAALRIYFLSNLGRYLPGKIWQIGGYAVLAREAGLPASASLAAAGLAQVAFLTTGCLVFALTLPRTSGGATALVAAGGALVLIAAVFTLARTAAGARARTALERRFGERVHAVFDALVRVRARDALSWIIGYGASWIVLGAAFVLFAAAFIPDAAIDAPARVAGSLAAAYVTGYVAVFAPAGVGVREGVLGVLLAQVFPASAAIVISIASRAWFTLAELVPLAALPLLRRYGRSAEDGNPVLGAP